MVPLLLQITLFLLVAFGLGIALMAIAIAILWAWSSSVGRHFAVYAGEDAEERLGDEGGHPIINPPAFDGEAVFQPVCQMKGCQQDAFSAGLCRRHYFDDPLIRRAARAARKGLA